MRKAVAVLTLSTIALTATSLYYAHELGELRSALPPAEAVPAPPAGDVSAPTVANEPADVARTALTPSVPGPSALMPSKTPSAASIDLATRGDTPDARTAEQRARDIAEFRDFLARYNDPAQRETMRAASSRTWRERLRRVRDAANLSTDQWKALVELRVDERLDRKKRFAECALDPACQMPMPVPAELQERSRKLAEEIGDKNMALASAEQRRGPEVRTVEQLRTRLSPALRLSRDAEETLMDALADETQQAIHEMQLGNRVTAYWGNYGIIVFVNDVPTLEENLEIVRRFSSRISDRAATMLSATRMETFNTLQADGVVTFRAFMRKELSLRAAGFDGL